ncbi:hypothetical protein [Mycobacterium sp. 236(2023)]|uniref:hypothetical protein n=1 Tax=Mycobacterium sp. 236(2023) TaxID=3038163 RepID=UPI0024152649|nr:hypothetical protein [Mycobacterium sp. 236(2023)]MDG4665959.1 hypothetical protein [Mycobacterium sp. 236(2023)]
MVADTDVIDGNSLPEPPPGEQTAAPTSKRAWSMPKSPVSRQQVDDLGRVAATAAAAATKSFARSVAALARFCGRAAAHGWRAIERVPAHVRLLFVVAVVMLSGVVGSIALSGTAGLICAIVVVPVSSITIGALGHRWYSRQSGDATPHIDSSELARSMGYVDRKLTLALNTFGSERHQQAVIALFQAKTAVELTLGTEQDYATHIDEPVSVDDYGLRPRIQAGPASTSPPPESNSLAAS